MTCSNSTCSLHLFEAMYIQSAEPILQPFSTGLTAANAAVWHPHLFHQLAPFWDSSFIIRLNLVPGEVFGWGHLACSGTLMHLKPWPLYNLMAAKLFASQCSATERQPQLRARASALAISILAMPLRLSASRTATLDIYAIPFLHKLQG